MRRPRPIAALLLVAALALTAACSTSDATDDDLTFDDTTETDDTTPTTETTTTTTEPATTQTTLTAEQQAFLEEVELVEQLMQPIRAYHDARNACLLDLNGCDFNRFTQPLRGSLVDDMLTNMESIIAKGVHYEDSINGFYYVQHFIDNETPLIAQVWTCHTTLSTPFTLDDEGNPTYRETLERSDDLVVFQVSEAGGGPLQVEIIRPLDDDSDPGPEGGTCDTYSNWPPPLPSP